MIRRTVFRKRELLVALVVVGVTACAPQAAPAPAPVPDAAAEPSERPEHTDADVRFLQRMIPHHAQALLMTEMVADRTDDRALRLIAERVTVSQQDEIALMQSWLRRHGEEVPDADPHSHHAMGHMQMAGMLTAEQLDRLRAASGPEFDRLFLEGMIQHHQGALVMVAELFDTPGASQVSSIFNIASEIDADQRAEIARMQRLLAERFPSGG